MGLGDLSTALNKQKDRAEGKGGFGGGNLSPLVYTPKLKMRDGQSIVVRFNGSPDEPRVLLFHSFNRGNGSYDSLICAVPFMEPRPGQRQDEIRGKFSHLLKEPHAGCVFCHEKKAGNKMVGGASEKAVLALVDTTSVHYVPNEEGTKNRDGEIYVNDRACTLDDKGFCDHCDSQEVITWGKHKGVRVADKHYAGQFKWELAMAGATVLWGQYLQLRKWCAVCWPKGAGAGTGKIRTIKYACSECEALIDVRAYDPTKGLNFTCGTCQKVMVPTETCQCSNGCTDARRTSIWDGEWRVTRTGASTNTTYALVFLGVSPMEDWMFDLTPPDLDKEERPMSAAKMAEKLGVENPFQGQAVSNSSSGGARITRPNSAGPAPAITGPARGAPPARQVVATRVAASVPYGGDSLTDDAPNDDDIGF